MYLRRLSIIISRQAGHSKWQNIRHTKANKDTQRSIMFSKFGHKIKIAIKENGNNINPTSNHHLAQIIELAKKNDMPVSTIQSFIKATQTDKSVTKPTMFTVKGPKGSILLVSTLTASPKRTKYELCGCLNKVGGIMSDQNLETSFNRKGIIIATPPPDTSNIEESSVDDAIEVGAEEVSPPNEDNTLEFYCEMSELHKVKTKLQELKYTIEDAKLSYIAKMKVSLNSDEMELMHSIISKLEEQQDVVEIYDNIE